MTIIGIYAPEEGKREETEIFYDQLQKQLEKNNKNDYIILCDDFNARVGNTSIPEIMGDNGEHHLNAYGKELRQFATMNHLEISNTFFRKRDIHKYTWSARGLRSIIDYFFINDKMRPQIIDVNVYRGCDIASDDYLIVAKLRIWMKWKSQKSRQRIQEEVYKTYLLQKESIQRLYQQRLQYYLLETPTVECIEIEWDNVKFCMEKAASEAIGKK